MPIKIYKVVTNTAAPNEFKPWFVLGPCFETTKYKVGDITRRELGFGPLVAFRSYYDALSLYNLMPRNLYDTPMSIIQGEGVLSKDVLDIQFSRRPGTVFCDTIRVIKVMPTGGYSSNE